MKNPIIDAALKAQHDSGVQVLLRDVPLGTIVLLYFGGAVRIGIVYADAANDGTREFKSLYGMDITIILTASSTYMGIPLNVVPVTL